MAIEYHLGVYNPLPVLQALADPTRLAVFECIRGCGGATAYDSSTGECDAGELGAVSLCDVKCHVPCAPSTLTHHLNALRDAGLIVTERRGRKVFARIVPDSLTKFADHFQKPTGCNGPTVLAAPSTPYSPS